VRDKCKKLINSDGNTGYKKGCVRKYVILSESICSIILYNICSKTSPSIQRSKHGVKKIFIIFIMIVWGNCWKQEFQILSRRKHISIHDFHTMLSKTQFALPLWWMDNSNILGSVSIPVHDRYIALETTRITSDISWKQQNTSNLHSSSVLILNHHTMMIEGIYHIATCLQINQERVTTCTLHFVYKICSF
jgi:hypothetical protein